MKLLFVSQVPDTRLAGVSRVLYCVGDALRERGHTVHYLFEDEGPKLWFPRMGLLEYSARIAPVVAERCARERYDAIILTTLTGWALSTFRKRFLPPDTKVLMWSHGWEELMWEQMREEERVGGARFSARFKLYYRWGVIPALLQALRTGDGVFCVSSEERDAIAKRHPREGSKALFVPNGVAEPYFYPERFNLAPESTTENRPRLLFVGYWDPWRKGKRYLIEAFTELHRRDPNLQLSLVGIKVGREEILAEFPEPCRGNIRVLESVDEPQLRTEYREHDIFLLPSLFEGMPLVLLEAMAAGMAVVTTDACGMRDVCLDGQNALLVPRRNADALVEAVESLIESPDLRRRLGQRAMTDMRHYTWERIEAMFEENLLNVVETSKLTTRSKGTMGSGVP